MVAPNLATSHSANRIDVPLRVFGDMLRSVMSSIMRCRSGDTGFVMEHSCPWIHEECSPRRQEGALATPTSPTDCWLRVGKQIIFRHSRNGSVEPYSLSSLIGSSLIRPLKMDGADARSSQKDRPASRRA